MLATQSQDVPLGIIDRLVKKTQAPIGWKTLPFIGQRVLENELLFSLPWNCLRLDQAWSSSMNDAFKTWRSSSMEAIGTKLIQTGPPPKRLLLVFSSWIHLSCHATGASLVQECGWRHCRLQQLHRYTPLEELEEVSRKEAHLQRGPRDHVTYLLHICYICSIMFRSCFQVRTNMEKQWEAWTQVCLHD